MKTINVLIGSKKTLIKVDRKIFDIGNPERVCLTKLSNLLVLYNISIPESSQEQLARFVDVINTDAKIIPADYHKPDNNNMYVIHIPTEYHLNIKTDF